jgi:hypothetical protein
VVASGRVALLAFLEARGSRRPVDGLEHGVVEVTAHRRPRLCVGGVAVACESDGGSENVLPAVEIALSVSSSPLAACSAPPMRSCSVFKRSSGIAFA